MSTMNVSLPDDMREYVDLRVCEGGYATSSEYMRELVRFDQEREVLRKLLMAGGESPVAGAADARYFSGLRQRVKAKAKATKATKAAKAAKAAGAETAATAAGKRRAAT